MHALRPLNLDFKAWCSVVHCTVACRTSSTNFFVVGPMATKIIVLRVCWRAFNLLWKFYDSWITSLTHSYILFEMIEALQHISSIWVCIVFPCWILRNLCTSVKVYVVNLSTYAEVRQNLRSENHIYLGQWATSKRLYHFKKDKIVGQWSKPIVAECP